MQIINKDQIQQMLEGLANEYALYVPGDLNELSQFIPFNLVKSNKATLMLDQPVTLSPKGLFLPQSEPMYRFITKGKQLSIDLIPDDGQSQVIFGMRHCDIHGIKCLDQVFLSEDFTDPQYLEKRENSVIFALSCNEPWKACFCTSMGVDQEKADQSVADVQMYEFEDSYGFIATSEKGKKSLEKISNLFTNAIDEIPKQKPPSLQLKTQGLPQTLATMFENQIWQEFSFKCIECGTCTYICPSCYCFDLNNKIRGEVGVKLRTWDSCMFEEYTAMAGGHQPRPGKEQRIRNRFLHKLQYFNENHGMFLCTGCGRCVEKCPANIDITKFINQVGQ